MTSHVPYSFVPGTKASAQEMNANFISVLEQIDTKANCDLSNLSQTGQDYIKNCSISRSIGEIVQSCIPLHDSGLHLLDGAIVQNSGIYKNFVNYISELYEERPTLFITEAQWQQSITDYGVCGKFVYDSVNNTIRLPKVTGIIEGTSDLTALGDLVEESLPNHTHNYTDYYANFDQGHGGSLPLVPSNNTSTIRTSEGSNNSVYKDNAHVQPQTIKVLYYIVVATSSKTDIQVDIDEIATDLNGKADTDLSNTTPAISFAAAMNTAGIRTVVETYQNGTSWYRVYSDGWCEQGGATSVGADAPISVTLLKAYTNNLYSVQITINGTASSAIGNTYPYQALGKTASSFIVANYNSSPGANNYYQWQTCGYIN